MTDSIRCKDCGAALSDAPNTPPAGRVPCPACGSVERSFYIHAAAQFRATGSLSATLTVERSVATLLLQSIIVAGANVTEGQLVEAVALPWFEIVRAVNRDPAVIHQIPARKWEEIVAGAYDKAGFDEVILTPRSGDCGRDVIATKRGLGTVRVIDQVKAFGPGHLVTADDVRALLGVLIADGASKGFLTTTSDFAPRLRADVLLKPFVPSRLELINGTLLVAELQRLAGEQSR